MGAASAGLRTTKLLWEVTSGLQTPDEYTFLVVFILCTNTKDFSPKTILPNLATAFFSFHFKGFERRGNFLQFVIMEN